MSGCQPALRPAAAHNARRATAAKPAALQRAGGGRLSAPPLPPFVAARLQKHFCTLLPHAAAYSEASRDQRDKGARADEDMQMWMDRLGNMRPSWRSVALQQLLRIEQDGAYAGLVGGSPGGGAHPDDSGGGDAGRAWGRALSPRDTRSVTNIVAGVTRWRRRLDYVIDQLSKRPARELDAPLRQVLRMGVLELLERGAPEHTVNEHVALVKSVMHVGAGNVANFVLRELVRRREAGTLVQPPQPAQGQPLEAAADTLAVGASHPTWLVAAWLAQYGPQATLALLRWNNQPPRYALRLTPGIDPPTLCQQLAEEGIKAQPSRYLPRDYITIASGMQALLAGGRVARGEVQVQDEAAGLVVALLDPQPGEAVLDACAAPGGKTMYCAARMQGRGSILALDVGRARLAALRNMAARQEHGSMVATVAMDLRDFAAERQEAGEEAQAAGGSAPAAAAAAGSEWGQQAAQQDGKVRRRRMHWDKVLLDAPCSGTGVLAKRADLRWRKQPADVAQMAALQGELLDAAAGLVAPGGVLVYSTCSLEAAENQKQVAAFLQRHPDYSIEAPPPSADLPPQCLSPEGFLTMLPHVHATDGAFAARLRRQ